MNRMNLRGATRSEEGMALITVMLTIVIVSVLTITSVTYATRSLGQSRRSQSSNAALPAADAGIDDFLTRLNRDTDLAKFPDTTIPALNSFVKIPGGSSEGSYKYTVDRENVGKDGRVTITSTGKVNGVERTVKADLRRSGFIEFLYFTVYEVRDPDQSGKNSASCTKYAWQGRDDNYCGVIQFAEDDVINGPIHSNDAMVMDTHKDGPTFNGAFSTFWSGSNGRLWRFASGADQKYTPKFLGGAPRRDDEKRMPPSNEAVADDAKEGGCLFTGPTSIKLKSNGTMDVVSPLSRNTNPDGTNNCSKSSLTGTGPHNLAIPGNKVIHVQPVPTKSSDPNYHKDNCKGSNPVHPLGYPKGGDDTKYSCGAGDLFIEGTLSGQLTASAANDIIVTWHLTYSDKTMTNNDMLGLIAHNYVWVYHPVDGSKNLNVQNSKPFENPHIQAAILAVNHSFGVQNYDKGSRIGTLKVDGSIAQKFRGPVGATGGTCGSSGCGYLKDYNYDDRLKFISPPKFLEPLDAPWTVVRWEERSSADHLQ